ncbi:ketosteroid isomerase-like protein [Parvibaculum indicum]|uniref:nuclear transport factor 2 family protein n=1 Tax=Parvibaculum indicum TaxID=562969 RepID=UPI00142225A2|nr:nuclear transport factor 2 family protein [Parvibaculum indicum]NIJ40247.1 ketosteroid isomerase-like protein [Parvibaculum indicum]
MNDLPLMVRKWQAAWQALDPQAVAALYAPDGTHMSGVVRERLGKEDATLHGRDEVLGYATASARALESFRADILSVIAEGDDDTGRAAVEYLRILNGNDASPMRVMEAMEWRGGRITACRVFHF